MHGGVGLQGGKAQIAALCLEGDGVSDDGTNPKASIQLTVINVAILAQVDVEHAVKSEAGHNINSDFKRCLLKQNLSKDWVSDTLYPDVDH